MRELVNEATKKKTITRTRMRKRMNPPQQTKDGFMKFLGIKNLTAFPQKSHITDFPH
jgi:hypothetical protein